MWYFVYAFTEKGAAITEQLFLGMGYEIVKVSSKKNFQDGEYAKFSVNMKTRSIRYYVFKNFKNFQAFNDGTAFRAFTFINKYQKDAREVI